MVLSDFFALALLFKATTYGYGEGNCGDPETPRKCTKGAITASGQVFDPDLPTAALPTARSTRIKPFKAYLKAKNGSTCAWILINDKKNWRYVGQPYGGLDMSPGALKALGITPRGTWTGLIEECEQ